MGALLRTLSAAAILTGAATEPAAAYPVDCAILLYLAGGWPAHPVCQNARAVFMTRATPWPVEPPLQIWRLPHGRGRGRGRRGSVAVHGGGRRHLRPRLRPRPLDPGPRHQYCQRSTSEGQECYRSDRSRLGAYGPQGEFAWEEMSVAAVPAASTFDPPPDCRTYRYRGVVVSWADAEGERSYEEVRY